jgi:hypothetical protein
MSKKYYLKMPGREPVIDIATSYPPETQKQINSLNFLFNALQSEAVKKFGTNKLPREISKKVKKLDETKADFIKDLSKFRWEEINKKPEEKNKIFERMDEFVSSYSTNVQKVMDEIANYIEVDNSTIQ